MPGNKNQIILNYHESLLRLSDVDLLRGPCWLNDNIISFYFEYLERRQFKTNQNLLFVSPQVTQCIKITPANEIAVFLEPLNANKRHFIFFALNDNEQTEVSGGSHWSLLVYSNQERMIYHFDSSRGSNQEQAVEFAEKVSTYFSLPSYGSFCEPICLQQNNGYDCGIHVLCNAENIGEFVIKYCKVQGCPIIHRDEVYTKRTELLDLITELQNL